MLMNPRIRIPKAVSPARSVSFCEIPDQISPDATVELFDGWDDPELSWPEPIDNPLTANFFDSCRIISPHYRVLLSGEGSDNLLDFQMWPYAKSLWQNRNWGRLFTADGRFFVGSALSVAGPPSTSQESSRKGRRCTCVSKLSGTGLRTPHRSESAVEEWVRASRGSERHPVRPRAHASLSLPHWTHMFELENPGATHFPIETRYPFLDLRIVDFLLALPPFPWCFEKKLLREAMVGRLPASVRVRPKTPAQGDALSEQFKRTGADRLKQMPWDRDLDRFIDRIALAPPHAKMNAEQLCASLRPACLNIWLQSARRVRYNIHAEAANG